MAAHVAAKVVLYLFLSLLLSFISVELKKKYKIPTFLSLILLGVLTREISLISKQLESTTAIVEGTIAPVVQLTMVPCIIFEAAFTTDWYKFKKQLGQIIPLATTVVVLSSVLTAVIIDFMFDYNLSWEESLVLGLILSATDHVAVKTTLKDIHVSDKLESLMGGETLLNETTVLVFYKVLQRTLVDQVGSGILFAYFLKLCIGGLAIGMFFSMIMSFSLKRMINDYVQETNLTIVCTYLTFWLCDNHNLGFSGAFGVMVLGLFMSAYGKILISPSVYKKLHGIWKLLSCNIQMLVFIIGGMLLEKYISFESTFGIKDFGFVLVLFIFIHLIRGIALVLHYPVFRYFGYGISFQEILIMTIAGFKGVISTALSLIVYNDNDLNLEFRKTVLFFTVTIVALSISLDTLLLKFVTHKFKTEILSQAQESVLFGVTSTIIHHTNKKIEKLNRMHDLRLIKWEEVMNLAGPKLVLMEMIGRTQAGKTVIKDRLNESVEHLANIYTSKFTLSSNEVLSEMKKRYYSILKRVYWNSFVSGQCRGTTALKLIDSCNRALDLNHIVINDWQQLESQIFSEKKMNFYKRYKDTPVIGSIFRKIIYENIISAYDIAHTFVRGNYLAEKIIENMEIQFDDEVNEHILEEAHEQIFKCQDFIKNYITDSYPEVIADVQTKMSSYSLLYQQRTMVSKIYSQGLVKELEHHHLENALHKNLKLLAFMTNPSIPTMFEMLKKRFSKSRKSDIERILPFVIEKHYQPGTFLFKDGEEITGAYLIFSGKVHEYGHMIQQDLTKDNIAGAYCLIDSFNEKYITTSITNSVVIAGFIPLGLIKEECFVEEVYRESVLHLLVNFREKFGISEAREEQIQRISENSKAWYIQAGAPINLRRGALVLMGRLRKDKETFDLVRPCKKIIESLEDAVVLIFPPHFGSILRQHRLLSEALISYFIKYKSRKSRVTSESFMINSHFKIDNFSQSGSEVSEMSD
jgi:CPA1 family monovalent cation:H+ antiporter